MLGENIRSLQECSVCIYAVNLEERVLRDRQFIVATFAWIILQFSSSPPSMVFSEKST